VSGKEPTRNEDPHRYERLCAEHDEYGRAIRELVTSLARMLSIALGVLGLGASFGTGQDRDLLIIVLPFALYVLAAYSLWLIGELMAMGMYKAYLEDEIQTYLERRYVTWERDIAPDRHLPIPQFAAHGLYAVGMVASAYHSWRRVGDLGQRRSQPSAVHIDGWVIDGVRGFLIAGALALLFAFLDANYWTPAAVRKAIESRQITD
jgi:hypothetical protein